MVSVSQRLSRSGALTSACLHVHVERALLFSFLCRSQRCRDISRIGSSQKVISIVLHTFPKLGSGAMGFRFRQQLTHWTDPAVFTQPDQWKGFLSAMVTAHEADTLYMRNFLEEITKNKYNQGGLTDAERSQTRHFREQREEQVVFPSVVRRVLFVGRTDSPRFRKDVEIGCTDARVGQGQVH